MMRPLTFRTRGLTLAVSALMFLIVLSAASGDAHAVEQVVLEPSADTTLFEEDGNLSNGAGNYLFFGLTADGFARRCLLLFDIAGSVPAGSTILDAELSFVVDRQPAGAPAGSIALYRSGEPWGEAGSDAPGFEGTGTQAEPGDATWTHRLYETVRWVTEGGELILPVSSQELITGLGPFGFEGLTVDVQDMLDVPATNFGWIVVGDEVPNSLTARRIGSRENGDAGARPELRITYDPPVPADAPSVGSLKGGFGQ